MSQMKRFFIIIATILALAAIALAANHWLSVPAVDTPAGEGSQSEPADGLPLGTISDVEPIIIETPEYMTDGEIKDLHLRPSQKIQVLERDENGKILSYKLITKDEDVLTEYYPIEDSADLQAKAGD
jgi:hypothetical protein